MTLRFAYTGIRVRNMRRSLAFYQKVMGMRVVGRGRMPSVPNGGRFVTLVSPGSAQRLELNWYPRRNKFYSAYRNGEELDHLAFWVDDVCGRFDEIIDRGGKVAVMPFNEGGYELAFIKDPDGIWIELIGRAKRRARS